jgi:hypothetical protein
MTLSTGSSESPIANPLSTAHRVRVIIFRVVATLAGLFFVVAVVLMASTPWVLLQPDQEVRTELDRWFLTVAGSVDAITAGVLLALARRLRRTLLVGSRTGRCSHCGPAPSSFPSSQHSLPSSQSAWCR